MSLTAQNLVDRAAAVLNDASFTRWSSAELLNWLNDGRREMALLRPDLYATAGTHSCAAGAPQTLATGSRLLNVLKNTSGTGITPIDKRALDAKQPGWLVLAQSGTILHFAFDEVSPRVFYTYPPALVSTSLDIVYVPTLTDHSSGTSLTDGEELYCNALIDFVCYRAISKDVEFAGNANRAAAHYTAFKEALTAGGQTALGSSPNRAFSRQPA